MLPRLKFILERWKYNSEYEVYVSTLGRIKDKEKRDVMPAINAAGYLVVYTGGNNPKIMTVHRLVMITYRPCKNAKDLTIDHIDHNKRNPALKNLEWVTREENVRRAKRDFVAEPCEESPRIKNIIGIAVRKYDFKLKREQTLFCCSDRTLFKQKVLTVINDSANLEEAMKAFDDIMSGKNNMGKKVVSGMIIFAEYAS